MESNKKSVLVYESFYNITKFIESDSDLRILFNAMMEYGMYGIEPEFDSLHLKMAWAGYKPNMDANIKRYNKAVESGKKGGLAKAAKAAKAQAEKEASEKSKKEEPSKAEEQKPFVEEQTINDDIDNIQGIEIDEETEEEIKEPYENFSMDDPKIPVELLIDYYNTVDFNNQLKRVQVYNMIENREIKTKQEILEYAEF